MNFDPNRLSEWLIDNKLSKNIGEDKTKIILFKRENKSNLSLIITPNEIAIKQDLVVEYLGCLLEEDMLGKAMARMVLKIINRKKKFLYKQSRCLLYSSKRILYSTLIQPHYDFASGS